MTGAAGSSSRDAGPTPRGQRRRRPDAPSSPRWARRILLWLLDAPSAEFIVGDLDEAYRTELDEGRRGARLRYWRMAIASLASRRSGGKANPAPGSGPAPPRWTRGAGGELRFATRILRRSPGFAATAIVTLALGIGANTAVFSVLNGVLLRPLPYAEPHQLVNVWQIFNEWLDSDVPLFRSLATHMNASYPVFRDWQERGHVFEGIAAYTDTNVVVEGPALAEWLPITLASASLFDVLGVEPALGRGILPEEDVNGAERVVVLSHGFWMRRFGGDPAVLGRELVLTGVAHTIVGVMPPGFYFPEREQELWTPLQDRNRAPRWSSQSLNVIARLRPGIDLSAAQREMDAVTVQIMEDNPDSPDVGIRLVGRVDEIAAESGTTLRLLMATVGLVLLVTAANLAGLLMVRAGGRRRELAVRRALGAGSARLGAELVIESLMLAAAGGALGLAVTTASIGWIKTLLPDTIPRIEDIAIDGRVLGFAAAASVLIALMFGVASALHAGRFQPATVLRGDRTGRSAQRGRSVLVVAEVAVAVVLLLGAALLLRSYANLRGAERGFDAGNVLTFRVSAPVDAWGDAAFLTAFQHRVIDAVEQIPGVQSAATSSLLPFTGSVSASSFRLNDSADGESEAWSLEATVSTGYFETLGVPLLRGRVFDGRDTADGAKVVVINERLAEQYWPGGDPVGELAWEEGVPYTIIGVVADNKHASLSEQTERLRYRVDTQDPDVLTWFAVRTLVPPASVAPAVRDAVRRASAGASVSQLGSLESLVDHTTALPRFRTLMLTGLAVIAVTLAVLGVYGVVSLAVAERRREIGVRMALGARREDVLRQVLGSAARLVMPGLLLGIAAAAAAVRLIDSYVYGVSATDPAVFAAVVAAVAAVAMVATWIPARQATRIHPIIVLRGD